MKRFILSFFVLASCGHTPPMPRDHDPARPEQSTASRPEPTTNDPLAEKVE